jgi:hypothetical protein
VLLPVSWPRHWRGSHGLRRNSDRHQFGISSSFPRSELLVNTLLGWRKGLRKHNSVQWPWTCW